MVDLTRRHYIGGLASIAAARWESQDVDIENVDEWDPIEGASFTTGSFTPASMRTSGTGPSSDWLLEANQLDEMTVDVFYDENGVYLAIEGDGDGVHGGAMSEFDPELARQAAGALYQAAEEYEQRTRGDDADE